MCKTFILFCIWPFTGYMGMPGFTYNNTHIQCNIIIFKLVFTLNVNNIYLHMHVYLISFSYSYPSFR